MVQLIVYFGILYLFHFGEAQMQFLVVDHIRNDCLLHRQGKANENFFCTCTKHALFDK